MADDTRSTWTLIPAAPGWYVVFYDHRDAALLLEAVIAWEIETHQFSRRGEERRASHYALPVTALGSPAIDGVWALKIPDGTYEIPECCACKSDAEVLAALKAKHEEEEQLRRERAEKRA